MEAWQDDRFDPEAFERWLQLMEKAAAPRLARWMMERKKDLLDLFLNKCAELRIREHDQDPSDFGKGFLTFDGVTYIRVLPPIGPADTAALQQEKREQLLTRLLEKIADLDHLRYQQALLDAHGLIPAEAEEEAYRMRNVRLAEKGFAPTDEAVGIYQRLKPETLFQKGRKHLLREPESASKLPVPRFAEGLFDAKGLFAQALSAVASSAALLQLQQEFAGLCNRVIAADRTAVREREALRAVVEKAAGYLSIALAHLTADDKGEPQAAAARLLEDYPLVELFRVGHGLAMELKWKAEKWQKQSWAKAQADLPLSFWDEEWVGVLGGLLLARPRFFDNFRTGRTMYRDFTTLEDIRWTDAHLEQVIHTDRVLSMMKIDTAGSRPQGLTYKNLLLTLWASEDMGIGSPDRPAPLVPTLPLAKIRRFHRRLFPEGVSADPARPRRIADPIKEAFAGWLSRRTGLDAADIGGQMAPTLEALFADLEEELGAVDSTDIDPRYLRLFLVARRDSDGE
jgi:hypothetical protein